MKKKSPSKKKKVVMVSGGFDPIHVGHIRLLQEAKKLGDELVVLLNNDHWLKLKKGFVFMSEFERKEIIEAFHFVDRVVLSSHKKNTKDISVIEDIRVLRPHVFAKGGDRHSGNIPELEICNEVGCVVVNDVGWGGKVQSSSELVKKAKLKRPARRDGKK